MRALIVGGDSGIGKALTLALLKNKWEVSCTSRHPEGRPGFHYLDLGTLKGLDELPQCDHLFLCAAVTKLLTCRENPSNARKINLDAPVTIAKKFASEGAHSIFLSTSAVFNGTVPRQMAEAIPTPTSEYGSLKAEAERILLSTVHKIAVLRLTKVLIPGSTILSIWIESLKNGKEVNAFYDMFMAPITLPNVVDPLISIATRKERGIFQVSASEDISYFDAARYIAEGLGVSKSLVIQESATNAGIPIIERPRYTSLDTRRVDSLLKMNASTPFWALDKLIHLS